MEGEMIDRRSVIADVCSEIEAIQRRVATLVTEVACAEVELQIDCGTVRQWRRVSLEAFYISGDLMRSIIYVQRAAGERSNEAREIEADATGSARRSVMQTVEVRRSTTVEFDIGLQIIE